MLSFSIIIQLALFFSAVSACLALDDWINGVAAPVAKDVPLYEAFSIVTIIVSP